MMLIFFLIVIYLVILFFMYILNDELALPTWGVVRDSALFLLLISVIIIPGYLIIKHYENEKNSRKQYYEIQM
jgi:hypothetical protein